MKNIYGTMVICGLPTLTEKCEVMDPPYNLTLLLQILFHNKFKLFFFLVGDMIKNVLIPLIKICPYPT